MPLPTSLRFTIGDAHAIVAGLSPALADRLRDVLRRFAIAADDAGGEAIRIAVHEAEDDRNGTHWIVRLRDEELCGHARGDDLLQYLEWLAISQALTTTRRYAVFHGASLAYEGEGEAATVMLVGPSGAGKSTLTLNLIRRGWHPLADDMTLVDLATGAIHPFPRCFHVEPERMADEADKSAFEWPVGGIAGFARPWQWAAAGHRVTALFDVERDPVGPSARTPMTQAQGAGILLTQSIQTALTPTEVAQAAARVAGGARCYHLVNGDLEGALDLITASAGGTAAPGARWSPARRRRPAGSAPARSTRAP